MDVPALIRHAQSQLGINEAELARRLGTGQATVNRWARAEATPDFKSCLMLARETGISAKKWLVAAGHDPRLLYESIEVSEGRSEDERYVERRTRRMLRLLEAVRGLPTPFTEAYLRSVLDKRDDDFEEFVEQILSLARQQATQEPEPELDPPEPTPRPAGHRLAMTA